MRFSVNKNHGSVIIITTALAKHTTTYLFSRKDAKEISGFVIIITHTSKINAKALLLKRSLRRKSNGDVLNFRVDVCFYTSTAV